MRDDMPPPAVRGRGSPPSAARVLQRLQGVRSAEQARQLLPLLPRLAEDYPLDHRIQRALSETALRAASLEQAVDRARAARALRPEDFGHRLHLAICLLAAGQHQEAATILCDAQEQARGSAREVSLLASLLVRASRHREAAECYERAAALEPGNARHQFSLAATYRFLGRLDEAEAACDRAIALDPAEYEAYLVRADLRTQTAANNHVDAMESVLANSAAPYMGEVMLCHALAKECEDLGDHARSFRYLARGAALRRKHLSYEVQRDIELIDELITQFPRERLQADGLGSEDTVLPVFVLGLPRTGTTLVERILSSHSQINTGGELTDFPQLVSRLADAIVPGCADDPMAMVRASLQIDREELGSRYLSAVGPHAQGAARLVDKLPFNYLNLGLIHRALPGATIIHVTRNPMDTCYAIFKTLFQRAYPFSYDLEDLGRYFIAYNKLMAHWQQALPGRICEVRYETLVTEPEQESRRLIAACGLDWEDGVSAFHTNPLPSMTASASQVRRPVYRSSLGKWRHYERELRPLLDRLRDAGIEVST
jgi:Flp pilus assembly protein TadD